MDVHPGDLPAAIADVGTVDVKSAAGIEVAQQPPGKIHGIVEMAVQSPQAHGLLIDGHGS